MATSCSAGRPFRFFPLPELADRPSEAGDTGIGDEHTGLAVSLAVLLHAQMGVVADAAGLADDEVGRCDDVVDALQAVSETAIVVQELTAGLLDHETVRIE